MNKEKLKTKIIEQLDFRDENEKRDYERKLNSISEIELQISLNYLIQGND